MKGLRKIIAPFAPDQSGAVAVLFGLKGIVVICDAGGCTGNICGFDEPRWFQEKSAVFSAGLRDMDAILGRDDRLVAKLADTAKKLDCRFAAIVGTPVPAVIATDYQALCRMAEKKTNLPVIAMDTTGTHLYDSGAGKAYLALMKRFADKTVKKKKDTVGILGVTPLDYPDEKSRDDFLECVKKQGKHGIVYGMQEGLDDFVNAPCVTKNIVVSPSGIEAARYLEEGFGIPYEKNVPLAAEYLKKCGVESEQLQTKKVLIVHQQILANSLRREIEKQCDAEVTVASWFHMEKEDMKQGDVSLIEEDQWVALVQEEQYDFIIGDLSLKKAVPFFKGTWLGLPHYAISGQIGCEK